MYNKHKAKLHDIIFEADTPAGKFFDIALLVLILLSIAVVMIDSIAPIHEKYTNQLLIIEWGITILFTIEYVLRLYCSYKPLKYAKSFYGIIDLISILPTFLSVVLVGGQYLAIVRALRLLRVFRILKMVSFLRESNTLLYALKTSRAKIMVFLVFLLIIATIMGSIMYVIEAGTNPQFSSIPKGVYWAIVTMTTVGYGDISPSTDFGQFISACLMIMGYAIIAVPTGIVGAEISKASTLKESDITTQHCQSCQREGHEKDAMYCKFCGHKMEVDIDS